MRGTLHVDPADAAPIWRQIEAGVRRLVASRGLEPGAAVPSVRELSRELRVNPATVAKAYQRLVDGGVLVVRRGEGTYVSAQAPALPDGEQGRVLRDGALRFASLAITVGADRDAASAALEGAFEELSVDERGERS